MSTPDDNNTALPGHKITTRYASFHRNIFVYVKLKFPLKKLDIIVYRYVFIVVFSYYTTSNKFKLVIT